jgi:polar amino acid transport system substrate-binding protein
MGAEFQNAEKTGKIEVQRVSDDETNFKKLRSGRIKLFPIIVDVGYDMLHNLFKPEEVSLFKYHPKPVDSATFHLLLSKKVPKNERLIVLFNKGLQRLKDSGKYDQFFEESRRGEYKMR